MIILADSGSTKTNWLLIEKGADEQRITTIGLNPFMVSDEVFENTINELKPLIKGSVEAIYFYGAGCRGGEINARFETLLSKNFSCTKVEVHSDFLAACRSTLFNQQGIAAIVGTGAICGYFDGVLSNITTPSLGYILGDEGSGTWYGKRLISDFFKQQMPQELSQTFSKTYGLTIDDVLQNTYMEKRPNNYLAQFTPFLTRHKNNLYCSNLLLEGIDLYIKRNIVPTLKENKTDKIGIVGSLAWHLKEKYTRQLQQVGFKEITILQNPLPNLSIFHSTDY